VHVTGPLGFKDIPPRRPKLGADDPVPTGASPRAAKPRREHTGPGHTTALAGKSWRSSAAGSPGTKNLIHNAYVMEKGVRPRGALETGDSLTIEGGVVGAPRRTLGRMREGDGLTCDGDLGFFGLANLTHSHQGRGG